MGPILRLTLSDDLLAALVLDGRIKRITLYIPLHTLHTIQLTQHDCLQQLDLQSTTCKTRPASAGEGEGDGERETEAGV